MTKAVIWCVLTMSKGDVCRQHGALVARRIKKFTTYRWHKSAVPKF